jgi:integral membrane protein (TIGR00529 family)
MILSIPVHLRVLIVFGLILILNRLRIKLSYSMLLGSLILGLWTGLCPLELIKSAFQSITRWQTVSLLLIVGIILIISRLMKDSGHLERIVESFGKISRDDRTTSSVMPALIGLLPMPGGALFSAPMVEAALKNRAIENEKKTVVNYWFRHVWEFWWPLYPGVVLAVALLRVDIWRYMAIMAPMTLLMILMGVVFILRPLSGSLSMRDKKLSFEDIKKFFWEIIPILMVVFVIIVLAGLTNFLNRIGFDIKINGSIPILPGLIASAIWVCVVNRVSKLKLKGAIINKEIPPMLLLVAAVMVFKGIMVDSHAVSAMRNELMAYNIPPILIIVIMPFLSGIITGIAFGFVGTSFPLIIPLFYTSNTFDYLSHAALAYTSGYMGMILSPVHLCFLVSKDYFKAGFFSSYRYLVLPAVAVMGTAAALFTLTRAVMRI